MEADMMPEPILAATRRPRYDDKPDDQENMPKLTPTQWSTSDGLAYVPTGRTRPTLPPGLYDVRHCSSVGVYLASIPIRTDGILRFPDTVSDKVVAQCHKFWLSEGRFRHFSLAYKRGILLYGPPGGGKTSTVQLVCREIYNLGGVVLKFGRPSLFIDGLRKFREIQPETPAVVLMEDIDDTVHQFGETETLNILDGAEEIANCIFLATTNYPEKLGPRFINRPSRFDKRYRIGMPSPETRRLYLEHLFDAIPAGECRPDIRKWVEDTDQFSLAHLKELFVGVVVLEDTYEETMGALKKMKRPIHSDQDNGAVGFGRSE